MGVSVMATPDIRSPSSATNPDSLSGSLPNPSLPLVIEPRSGNRSERSATEGGLMQFRVDTDGMTFIVGGIRGVMDFETKAQVLDKSSGVPLFDVDVMAVLSGERPEQLTVRVVGQPSGIEIGTRVRFRDLSARTWEMGDRHGVSFKASLVEPWTAGRSSGEGKAA